MKCCVKGSEWFNLLFKLLNGSLQVFASDRYETKPLSGNCFAVSQVVDFKMAERGHKDNIFKWQLTSNQATAYHEHVLLL